MDILHFKEVSTIVIKAKAPPHYPTLEGKIAERGLLKKDIAQSLGITDRALSDKLMGRSDFWYQEVITIQREFFPDVAKEDLFTLRSL